MITATLFIVEPSLQQTAQEAHLQEVRGQKAGGSDPETIAGT